jgi:protein-S-isoprenylcysteine O-methyltransferase Ste14
MAIYNLLIGASWLVLIAYWVLLAPHAKRSISAGWSWRREIGIRVAVVVFVLVGLHFWRAHHAPRFALRNAINKHQIAGFLGAALCASGVILAVWARGYLGRNWGMPMSEKASPELVMDGPYAYIRHPIYAGIMLVMIGSAIGQSVLWVIPLLIGGTYFVYSARREEELLSGHFPREYPAYVRHTHMLIPFVL